MRSAPFATRRSLQISTDRAQHWWEPAARSPSPLPLPLLLHHLRPQLWSSPRAQNRLDHHRSCRVNSVCARR